MKDYFQLRIPRDLKMFFDEYVEECKPLGITTGNEMMRYALILKASELREKLKTLNHSKDKPSKSDSITPSKSN